MNYKTCTLKELIDFINQCVVEAARSLSDSPKSRASAIHNHVGFFQGICMVRDFDYTYELIRDWQNLTN